MLFRLRSLDLLIGGDVADLLDGELLEVLPWLLPNGDLIDGTASAVLGLAVGRSELVSLHLSLLARRLADENLELGVESSDNLGVGLGDLKKQKFRSKYASSISIILFHISPTDQKHCVLSFYMFRLKCLLFTLSSFSIDRHYHNSFYSLILSLSFLCFFQLKNVFCLFIHLQLR